MIITDSSQSDPVSPSPVHTLPKALLSAYHRAFPGHNPDVFVRAPGRVNLLGGHVDIQEGTVLNIAIDRGVWLAVGYGAADLIHLHAADLDEQVAISIRRLDERVDVVGEALPRWARYPAGVAWALKRHNLKVNGIDAAFLGNVPMRAGLSSSAAVEMAFAVAWQALESWQAPPKDLILVGRAAEREYMGVGTGIQDQYTCLHAQRDHAIWVDCRSLEHEHYLFPAGARVVVCDTNTRRELVGSSYNGRAQDAHAAAHTIRLLDPEVKTLRDVTPDYLQEFQSVLSASEFQRARHVVTEIARVEAGRTALTNGDLHQFGKLMNESYWSARNDYESSSLALDAMWQAAASHPACYGARYSGGGEAGAVVALVNAGDVDDFIASTHKRYEALTGIAANLFVASPVEGAGVFI